MSKEQDENIYQIVHSLQRALLEAGFNPGRLDGDLGGITYKAYQNYKKAGILKAKKTTIIPPIPTRAPIKDDWRLARSLEVLRKQINVLAPKRNKENDGTIGDAKHKARTSDHNAWIKVAGEPDVVSALDITHDPARGCNCHILAEAIKFDPRVKYVIWNKKIWNIEKAKAWRTYIPPKGGDDHTHHMHISVKSDAAHYDNTKEWDLSYEVG